MPDQHAVLSPSSAARWISCPGSVRLAEQFPDQETPYALEGTQAHALAEIMASDRFGLMPNTAARVQAWMADVPAEQQEEMHVHAVSYADLLENLAAEMQPCAVLLERQVDPGVDGSWGTADAILIGPGQLHVVDYKYGKGVRVEAEANEQMMLYALGSLDIADMLGEVDEVCMTVFQPRIGNVSTWCTTAADLREWREAIRPAAAEALEGSERFVPSEKACRWCPASGSCKAQFTYLTERDFGDPARMTGADYAHALTQVPQIRDWLKALEEAALRRLYTDRKEIPGWKVVRSGGRRSISDQTAAIQTLIDAGFRAEQVADFRAKPLGQLEKVVGGAGTLTGMLGTLLTKSDGKPSLVPTSDRRPAIDISDEFDVIEE